MSTARLTDRVERFIGRLSECNKRTCSNRPSATEATAAMDNDGFSVVCPAHDPRNE
jgi:hypothetical protein